MVNTSCAVFRCGSTSHKHKGVRFHQFPRDERCLAWIQACKREDLKEKDAEQLKHMHICSLHFEQRMYGKLLLKKSAVPTMNLPATVTMTTATQTDNYNYAPLQVVTSQGVQTDDEVFYLISEPETAPQVHTNEFSHKNSYNNDHSSDFPHNYSRNYPNNYRIPTNANDETKFITIEQFLMGCDAFLPDSLNALIKSHIASLEYTNTTLS